MNTEDKREHILCVATKFFRRFGFNATGIDKIVDESGIAKTTLYRHFPSKDHLILAVLVRQDVRFRKDLCEAATSSSTDPERRILATFDFLSKWFHDESFNGCLFVCAATEFEDLAHPARVAAAEHKTSIRAYFEELAEAAGFSDSAGVAGQMQILNEGAVAIAHVTGNVDAATEARVIAEQLLAASPKAHQNRKTKTR